MSRWLSIAVAMLAVLTTNVRAEEPSVDLVRVCPIVSPELAAKIAAEVKGKGTCQVFCSGCGCKGGPGYRGPKGCVGWADLIRTCGPPPHSNCTRECGLVSKGCNFGRAWAKTFAAGVGMSMTFVPADPDKEPPSR